jgi:hypothetical protein
MKEKEKKLQEMKKKALKELLIKVRVNYLSKV